VPLYAEKPYSVKLLIGLLGGFVLGAVITMLCFSGAWYATVLSLIESLASFCC